MTPGSTERAARRERAALPPPELSAYSPAQVAFAARAWPMRAAEELRSALIFRALAGAARALISTGALDAAWSARLGAVIADELFHARLCAGVGARLGADRPRYDAAPVVARLAALREPRRRAVSIFLVEAAIGETVSMTLFRRGRRASVEPLTRAALTAILHDEVRHARLGWAGAQAIWPALGGEERDWLQGEATRALAALERTVAVPALKRLEAGEPFDPAHAALGVLHPESRVEVFYDAVERLVVPRLARLGLDGERAWRDRYRA